MYVSSSSSSISIISSSRSEAASSRHHVRRLHTVNYAWGRASRCIILCTEATLRGSTQQLTDGAGRRLQDVRPGWMAHAEAAAHWTLSVCLSSVLFVYRTRHLPATPTVVTVRLTSLLLSLPDVRRTFVALLLRDFFLHSHRSRQFSDYKCIVFVHVWKHELFSVIYKRL